MIHHGFPKWRQRSTVRFVLDNRPPWRWISIMVCSCGEPIYAVRIGNNTIPMKPGGTLATAEWNVDRMMSNIGYRRMDKWKRYPVRKEGR